VRAEIAYAIWIQRGIAHFLDVLIHKFV